MRPLRPCLQHRHQRRAAGDGHHDQPLHWSAVLRRVCALAWQVGAWRSALRLARVALHAVRRAALRRARPTPLAHSIPLLPAHLACPAHQLPGLLWSPGVALCVARAPPARAAPGLALAALVLAAARVQRVGPAPAGNRWPGCAGGWAGCAGRGPQQAGARTWHLLPCPTGRPAAVDPSARCPGGGLHLCRLPPLPACAWLQVAQRVIGFGISALTPLTILGIGV